jgi:hypothetical protein
MPDNRHLQRCPLLKSDTATIGVLEFMKQSSLVQTLCAFIVQQPSEVSLT